MNVRSVVLCLLLISPLQGWVQPVFVPETMYPNIRHFIARDALGSIFSLEDGTLHMHAQYMPYRTYSNASMGAVSFVEVSDPLHILAFHGDFGHVVFLDRNLSVKFAVSAAMLPHQPTVVCRSAQEGFWAWYPALSEMVRHNSRGQIQLRTPDLHNSPHNPGEVAFMTEREGKLFVAGEGIWVYDLFATFLFHIPHIHTAFFQVIGQHILYLDEGQLRVYDFFLQQENVILLPEKGAKSFFVTDDLLYLQMEEGLKKFRFTGNFY